MTLDAEITTILAKSLGPSAPIFLKQVCKKINKQPSDLTKSDLDSVINLIYEGVSKTLGDDTGKTIRDSLKSLK